MIQQILIMLLSRVFQVVKLKENQVLFLSDVRADIGDANLAYIYNYLPENYVKVTSFKADRRVKRGFKDFIRTVYNMSVSKYILLDDFSTYTSYFHVRKGQELVQLWHGPGAYKKFGHSRGIGDGDLQKVTIHPGYKRYTKAIVTSEEIRWCYAEAFNIDISKVKATGFPRTDMFFNKKLMAEKKKSVYKRYPFMKNKKVILFAPTYRGTKVHEANYGFDQLDLDKLYKELKDEYIFIFKWHPALYNNILNGTVEGYDLSKYKDFFYDLSEDRDVNELLLTTDVLVTDYSSIIFDWVLLNRPIVYFAYDKEEYENGRGLYYPFKEYIYGNVAKNTNELVKAIKKGDMLPKEREVFIEKFMKECDGHSTEKTYNWIFKGDKR